MSAIETFRQAILADVTETLNDRKNNLLARLPNPPCHCRNNLDYALSQLHKSASSSMNVFENIETYVLKKKCAHVWQRKRMLDASWDVFDQSQR